MLVSVTVEGSVGPIKALVRLGASVEEAIKAVLQRYKSEGRSPRLDTAVTASFQLHHSHFSLQSMAYFIIISTQPSAAPCFKLAIFHMP